MDKEIKVNYIEATENDPKQRKPDITKAHNILGFNPTIDIEIGLKRTIDYFTDLLYQSS
jgi:nucleoside-diphosphate-sugar epimerase